MECVLTRSYGSLERSYRDTISLNFYKDDKFSSMFRVLNAISLVINEAIY